MQGGKENENIQISADRDDAAGAADNEGDDSPVPVSDSGFKRVIVDCVLTAGDDSTGEYIPDSDNKRTDSVCERMAD